MHLPKELTRELDGAAPARPSVPFDYPIPDEGIDLDEVVEQFSHHLIHKAMQITGGNVSQAAKLLGIPRGTLRYKLDR
jgi:DNA-binding NtrC family response regulator